MLPSPSRPLPPSFPVANLGRGAGAGDGRAATAWRPSEGVRLSAVLRGAAAKSNPLPPGYGPGGESVEGEWGKMLTHSLRDAGDAAAAGRPMRAEVAAPLSEVPAARVALLGALADLLLLPASSGTEVGRCGVRPAPAGCCPKLSTGPRATPSDEGAAAVDTRGGLR